MTPSEQADDVFQDAREAGDVLDRLNFNRTPFMRNLIGCMATSITTEVLLVSGGAETADIIPAAALLTTASALGVAGAGLLPHGFATARRLSRAEKTTALQQAFQAETGEPTEVLRYGPRSDRKVALYWHLDTDDGPAARDRLDGLLENLDEHTGNQPDAIIMPAGTHRALWPDDPAQRPVTTMADFIKQQKRAALHIYGPLDQEVVVVPREAAHGAAVEPMEGRLSGLDFLAQTYAKTDINPATRQLLVRYSQHPREFNGQLKQALRRSLDQDLGDTVFHRRSRLHAPEKRHLVGHLEGARQVLWTDDRGQYARTDGLLDHTPAGTLGGQADLLSLLEADPRLARRVIERLLYVGLHDADQVERFGSKAPQAGYTSTVPALQKAILDRYASTRRDRPAKYKSLKENIRPAATPHKVIRAVAGLALATTLGVGSILGVTHEEDRLGSIGRQAAMTDFQRLADAERPARLAHPFGPEPSDRFVTYFGATPQAAANGGRRYLADHGNNEAQALTAVESVGDDLKYVYGTSYDWLGKELGFKPSDAEQAAQLVRGEAYNALDLSAPALSLGNAGDYANYPLWHMIAVGDASADGYWITGSGNEFLDTSDGWNATKSSGQPIQLMSREEVGRQPGSIEVFRSDLINPTVHDFNVPIKVGTRLAAVEATDETGQPIKFAAFANADGSARLSILRPAGSGKSDLHLAYYLVPDASAHPATAPLQVSLGNLDGKRPPLTPEQDAAQRAQLRDTLRQLDPAIVSITDPQELAAHIRNHFRYAVNPFTPIQESQLNPVKTMPDSILLPQTEYFLQMLYKNGRSNCNTAATLFGLAAYANGIKEPLSVVGGYLNAGTDVRTLSAHEAHEFIVDSRGRLIDPTPGGPLSAEDQAFFDESGQTGPSQSQRQELAFLGLIGLVAAGGAGYGAWRYHRRHPATLRQAQRQARADRRQRAALERTAPDTLALAHAALNHGYAAVPGDELDQLVAPVSLAHALTGGPVAKNREDLGRLRFKGHPLPRDAVATAERLIAQRSSPHRRLLP